MVTMSTAEQLTQLDMATMAQVQIPAAEVPASGKIDATATSKTYQLANKAIEE